MFQTARDVGALAVGWASLLPAPVQIFELRGAYLAPGEGSTLFEPLLRGETVLLLQTRDSEVGRELLDKWYWYAADPAHRSTDAAGVTLNPSPELAHPGFLAVVQIAAGAKQAPQDAPLFWLGESDADRIIECGEGHDLPIVRVGIQSRSAISGLSMKDLCLLHHRNSERVPSKSIVRSVVGLRRGPTGVGFSIQGRGALSVAVQPSAR